MRNFLIAIIPFILVSCIGNVEGSKYNLASVETEANTLLNNNTEFRILNKNDWPSYLTEIGATSIVVNEEGVYVELHSFFVLESGLFIPRFGVQVIKGVSQDPSYKKISKNVYSYYVQG